jgi:hypothetical protein
MERSGIRERCLLQAAPDSAALHPGYRFKESIPIPTPRKQSRRAERGAVPPKKGGRGKVEPLSRSTKSNPDSNALCQRLIKAGKSKMSVLGAWMEHS